MDVFLYLDQIHAEIVWDLFETNEDFCLEFYHLNYICEYTSNTPFMQPAMIDWYFKFPFLYSAGIYKFFKKGFPIQ
jgi:hypothetical protein